MRFKLRLLYFKNQEDFKKTPIYWITNSQNIFSHHKFHSLAI